MNDKTPTQAFRELGNTLRFGNRHGPSLKQWVEACEDSSELAQRKHARGHGVPPLWVRVVVVFVAAVFIVSLVAALGLVFGAPR